MMIRERVFVIVYFQFNVPIVSKLQDGEFTQIVYFQSKDRLLSVQRSYTFHKMIVYFEFQDRKCDLTDLVLIFSI